MYSTPNNKNNGVMFYLAKRDQSDKPRIVTDCRLNNLAVCRKQTSLRNIDNPIELVAAYVVWSKKDLVDGDFNVVVEESSEKWNTVLTTHGEMRSRVML